MNQRCPPSLSLTNPLGLILRRRVHLHRNRIQDNARLRGRIGGRSCPAAGVSGRMPVKDDFLKYIFPPCKGMF